MAPDHRSFGRPAAALGVVVALALGCILYHSLRSSHRSWDWNGVRIERTLVLAAGHSIYQDPRSGAVLNSIYGPIGAAAFLPAAVAERPGTAIYLGQLLAALWVLLPAVLLHLTAARRHAIAPAAAAWGILAFWALLLAARPLRYVSSTVHVDAPALGLGLLAVTALLFGGRGHRRLALAALLAWLAVWTKQVMAPLLLALPGYLWLAEGRRRAVHGALWLAVVGAATALGVFLIFAPPGRLYFYLVLLPLGHSWRWGGGLGALQRGAVTFARELWPLAPILAVTVGLYGRPRAGWTTGPGGGAPLLLAFAGTALLPTAFGGWIKAGGDVNALAYPLYFFGAAFTVTLMAKVGRRSAPSSRATVLVRRGMIGATVACVAGLGGLTAIGAAGNEGTTSPLPHEIAYRYARRHPGEVYFPRLTLSTFLAEGEVYHNGPGVIDFRMARLPIDPEHFRAHLPADLRAVAFAVNPYLSEKQLLPLDEFDRVGDDPELPGFVVFTRGAEAGAAVARPGSP